MHEIESKGLIQPLIVVMTGGKSAGIMVEQVDVQSEDRRSSACLHGSVLCF